MTKGKDWWYVEHGEVVHPVKPRTLKEVIADHLSYGRVAKRDKLRFLGLAAAGEAGELANDIKKEWRGDRKYRGKAGRAVFLAKLDTEIVDLANYAFMLAAERGLDLEAEMMKKLIEVEARDDDWNKVVKPKRKAGKSAALAASYSKNSAPDYSSPWYTMGATD